MLLRSGNKSPMRTIKLGFLLGVIFLLIFCRVEETNKDFLIPKSKDLKETGKSQRRDLSLPFSRIVLNFFDFDSDSNAFEFSNRPTMPLNVAYLSTKKNIKSKDSRTRFSRSVTDLITVHKSRYVNDIIENSAVGQAVSFETEWMPHALPFTAKYEDGSTLRGVDFFYDENTVVRKMVLSSVADLSFKGLYQGEVKFVNNKVIVSNNNINYCIAFNTGINKFISTDTAWCINMSEVSDAKEILISIAFRKKGESEDMLINRVQRPIENRDTDKVLGHMEHFWDDFIANLPHPVSYGFSNVKPDPNVSPESLKEAYYKAWVFLEQNILPADNEKFPYPQICTGKPSLWDEGEDRAPFSATWESLLGIQMYAYIDADLAWAAFKGLMLLVDEDGVLGGESLPSRKAQTAFVLYSLTGNIDSLREVYPALTRYLNWRMNITHWVYGILKPNENFKDAEFVFSALIDMEYMSKISEILGYDNDIEMWKKKRNGLSEQSLKWFWKTPESSPVQHYYIDSKKRTQGNTVWITTGFYVKNFLSGAYKESMLDLFDQDYDSESRFANFKQPKYPDISYTAYGLLEHGYYDRALGLIEANLRDIIKANATFAEVYVGENLQPIGVRPSLFGASTIIDFVWLLNGYKYDRGIPTVLMLSDERIKGLNNISVANHIYSLTIGKDGKINWTVKSDHAMEITTPWQESLRLK